MAYLMFDRPKLQNTKSFKFYPEECDHHVSFRHKSLPPDFDLTVDEASYHQVKPRISHEKKCPIYVHTFAKPVYNEDGDFAGKKTKSKKVKNKQSVIEKLEESYWANWKPEKEAKSKPKPSKVKPPEIEVIKSAPERRRKIKVYPQEAPTIQSQIESDNNKISNQSKEIQTEEVVIDIEPPEEVEIPIPEIVEVENTVEEKDKFLKHTDSLILSVKKHNKEENKEHYEQPKCIRLYKKPGKLLPKNYVKGGSYPLKSCLKKESFFARGNIRLGRPGSPIIVTSNYSRHSKAFSKR